MSRDVDKLSASLRTIAQHDRLGFIALARLIREVEKTAKRKVRR